MSKGKPQTRALFAAIGILIAKWNTLEWRLRFILFEIAYDAITASILTADIPTVNLLNAIRTMATERDITNSRINSVLKTAAKREKTRFKLYQPIAPHAHHLIEYADRLRLYRNFYVHGITMPEPGDILALHGVTSKTRFSTYNQPITIRNLRLLTKQIDKINAYALAVHAAIQANDAKQIHKRPTWPRKPPLPDKLAKPRTNLQDTLPPPLPLPE